MPNDGKFSQVLPIDWDGHFWFTNDSDEDFVFTWGKKDYLFPARRTIDMMRLAIQATPVEVQQIRRRAAQKWAEREFFKSDKVKQLQSFERNPQTNAPVLMGMQSARQYSLDDLAQDIQRCLTPLPEGTAAVAPADYRRTDKELHRDDDGTIVTRPVKSTGQTLEDPNTLMDSNEVLVN